MTKSLARVICTIFIFCCTSSYALPTHENNSDNQPANKAEVRCIAPPFLKSGDKVALISPAYATSMENVENTVKVLKGWGLTPVVGPNVGKVYLGKYAGTVEERVADIRWALADPEVKAIICNRGGYGTIQYVNDLTLQELATHPKWIVGFSDITTLHGLQTCAGVMSIHGTMSSFLGPSGGNDATSKLMRDLLMGSIPRYEVPAHPCNITGRASGILVGGNICTFAPLLNTQADATANDGIILFIEEVEESMHNLDRLLNMLMLNGVLSRCRGVVLGEFTGCRADIDYENVESLYKQYLKKYNIPVLCGFPAGHGDVNLPLVMGAPVTIDVRADGATLTFDFPGEQHTIRTDTMVSTGTSK